MTSGFHFPSDDPIEVINQANHIVVGQLGQSLDGRISTPTGDSKYINHKSGLQHLHRIRAAVDGVLVGVSTVNADNPRLTVRLCEGKNPTRIIVDPNARVFKDADLFSDGEADILIITAKDVDHPLADKFEVIALERDENHLSPVEIVSALNAHGIKKILVEGGSRTLSAFMNADAMDRLHLIVAPVLLGCGTSGINLTAFAKVDDAKRPTVSQYSLGHDLLFDCAF